MMKEDTKTAIGGIVYIVSIGIIFLLAWSFNRIILMHFGVSEYSTWMEVIALFSAFQSFFIVWSLYKLYQVIKKEFHL